MDNLKLVIWWRKIEDHIKFESFNHLYSKLLWWSSNLEIWFQVIKSRSIYEENSTIISLMRTGFSYG